MHELPGGVEAQAAGRERRQGVISWLRARVGDRNLIFIALAIILAVGASMRLTGINWDEGTHLHPDERFLTDVTSRLGWPQSLGEYFDEARSPLNPYNRDVGLFVYGTAPIFLVKRLGLLLGKDSYWEIHLVGRVVSAVYDLGVVLLVYLVGRRLYGRAVGLIASALMACTVLSIQHAHFYTVETFITLAITLAFLFAVRAMQGGGWADWALMGGAFGIAVAGKISMAMFLLAIGAVALLRALNEPAAATAAGPQLRRWRVGRLFGRLEAHGSSPRDLALRRGLLKAALGVGLAMVVALVAFRVTQPYAFAGSNPFSLRLSPRWQEDMSIAARLMDGSVDYPPSHQWTDREPIWFAWRNMVLWGMGAPLGLAAWVGWLVAGVELVRRRRLEHLPLLLWVTFSFLYMSVQFVKSIRYFLPIYPLLVILAAYFIVWLWRAARSLAARNAGRSRLAAWAPFAAGAVGAIVIVGTLLYAEGFTNIYRRPLSRVAASRWVYENIPPGSAITYEVWDDIIPQDIDGKSPVQHGYRLVRTEPYWEDIPEKRDALFSWLDEADYIILASNRLYDSIPRLPERYPLTTAYYRHLFSGELGFEVLKVFTSYPNLGPLRFVDDGADEAFTVYDHPKVTILRKTAAYSSSRARELLGDIPVDRLVRLSPVQTMRARHGLMLSAAERQAQERGGTWSSMFDRTSLANRVPVLAWVAVLELLAVAALPLAFVACGRLRDRGFILAKALGALLVSYLAWLGASLHAVPYTRATIAGATLLLLVGGWLAWARRGEIAAFVRREWRLLLVEELLYLGFLAAFLLVRLGNPDLWHPAMGGEKPMDLAYLNAIIKSTWFPPYDPWFAGGYINYYYFGHVIVATVTKLAAIVPEVAYNLAVPTLFAWTAMGAYAVVSSLLDTGEEGGRRPALDRAARWGLLGALLVAVLGNLGQVRLLLAGLAQVGGLETGGAVAGLAGLRRVLSGLYQVVIGGRSLGFRPEWWYWNASRVMGAGEINEFPFFSFLYADLHAHLIALPFGLLALGLTVSLLRQAAPRTPGDRSAPLPAGGAGAPIWRRLGRVDWGEWTALGLLALTLGALRTINTWDYPTYLLVALGGLVLARLLRREGVVWREAGAVAGRFALLVVASTLLFQPFHSRYGAAYTSVELWRGPRTAPRDYLVIHGLFLFILASYALSRAFGYQARGALARSVRLSLGRPLRLGRYNRLAGLLVQPSASFQLGWLGIVALLGGGALAALAGWWLVGLVLPLAAIAIGLVLRRDLPQAERLAALLFAGGLLLTLTVEIIVLRGDIGRMNTVFKFYLQVWVLWGVAAAVALASLAQRWGRWSAAKRTVWQAGLALLLCGAALYPLTATWGKISDRFDRSVGPILDGTAYAQTAVYHDQGRPLTLQADMEAIRWLQENVEGSPVILEGNAPLYRWGSRISIYTGLPTVVGWDWHQKQQRAIASGQVVDWRLDDVRRLYDGTDEAELERLLRLYNVSYVYVGELEQAYYSPEGLTKFERLSGWLFDVVYRQGPVTIYQVRQESLGGLSTRPFEMHGNSWELVGTRSDGGGSGEMQDPRARLSVSLPGMEQLSDRAYEFPRVPTSSHEPPEPYSHLGWNPLANAGPLAAIGCWWLALFVVGLGAWPLCFAVCRGLPDRGYLLARAVGWLLVAYALWLGASTRLVANRVPVAYACLALLLGVGGVLAYRQRRQMAAAWRARWGLLLREEALFSGAFLALVLVRLLNPDLWQPWFGGEKMMEFAYLNAILKSAHFPPYDPYFAGGHINYYYYGLYLVNVLVKLTGVVPEVAFNLAVPTFFALAVGQAFSLGHALTARLRGGRWLWGGLAAAVGVALLGNLTALAQWLGGLIALGGGTPQPDSGLEAVGALLVGLARWPFNLGWLPAFDYWYQATRVIPNTINEFPFFSYLFADLHPHMMSLPFTVATLVLVVGAWSVRPVRRGAVVLLALTVGALGPLNTWDLPTYLGLALMAILWLGSGRRALGQAAAVAALACLLYYPFYRHFDAPPLDVRLAPYHTRPRYFLVVWGLWLVVLYSWLSMRWWRGRRGAGRLAGLLRRGQGGRLWRAMGRGGWRRQPAALGRLAVAAAVLALVPLALVAGEPVVALLLPLAGLGADLWLRPDARRAERLAGLLAAAGCALLVFVELFFLADFLAGGEWERMNTFFKFGFQAWALLALAAAAGLPEMLAWLRRPGGMGRRTAWVAAVCLLAGISLAYVPLGVAARVGERFPGGAPPTWTLDGLAYMRNGVYHWPDESHAIVLRYDLEAIRWLQENVHGTPVIAEAPLGYYREGGMRVASYTGLPTLVGAHQAEQRSPALVYEREAQAEELYRSPDAQETMALMRRLGVEYIYWGQLEEAVYGAAAWNKFDGLAAGGELEVAYANARVTIYRVVGGG